MPWKEDGPMQRRVELIREWKEGESVTALAEAYGVARKTIYKWIEREASEGIAGLADRSRSPHTSPQRLSEEMIARILQARQRWGWGPRKLLVKLAAATPEQRLPSASTVAELLRSKGLSQARKRRLRTPPYGQPFAGVEQANQTWCADFKGWFRTGEGTRCDPLTITDAYSRYLLCCQIAAKTDTLHVEALFDAAFREYGLPEVIHTDNGAPFASRAPGGLSRLSMRWVRLGIVAERSRPSSPQDNGRHERMHRTLKQETLQPPARNPKRQQDAFQSWQKLYNEERPHESLNYRTPAACYAKSPRSFPRRVPEVEYDSGIFVRRVTQKGDLNWKNQRFFVSEIFAAQSLGLCPNHDRYYEVFYGPLSIGWFDTHQHQFHRSEPKSLRKERNQGLWK
jgi:transposase InsO family protein